MNYLIDGFLEALRLLVSGNEETFSAIFISLKISSLSIIGSLASGIPCGFLLGYYSFRGKKQIRTIVDTLLSMPTVVVGLIVYAFVSYRGPFGDYNLLFTIPGVAIAQMILVLPIVISLTASAVENSDERLNLTLMSLGASRHQMALATLYEVRYAMLTAAVTAYGRAISEVGVSMMIGGNIKWHTRTITTAIALETGKGQFSMGIALGLVLMTLSFLINWSVTALRKR